MRSIWNAAIFSGAAASLALAPISAHADVVISSAATANMSCSNGVCAPTAKDAVLNVGDLETLLASSDVEITTTGSGIQAADIAVDAPLTWSTANTLALDAQETVLIEKPVSVTGQGGISITTDDGGKNGYFGFQGQGHVSFANLSSALTINGAAYTLVGNIATLAADVAANSAGDYALANSYDAKSDGAYSNSPVPTQFSGTFEGLGNTISRLSIDDGQTGDNVGLFAELGLNGQAGGAVENIRLEKLIVRGGELTVGGLVGLSQGTISGSFVEGSLILDGESDIGGLVGYNAGSILRSGATGSLYGSDYPTVGGGLAGSNFGGISQSYADCALSGGDQGTIGGLVGGNAGQITESYAMGSVRGGNNTWLGGLTGANGNITQSYSTTALENVGRKDHDAGGLIGVDDTGGNNTDYWDTTSSNIKGRNQGAGTPSRDRGITGLSSQELLTRLPKGFDRKVWAQNPKINNGFPYLIANPPQ